MKRRIYNIGKSAILALALVMTFGASETSAQFKDMQLPKLSLTGEGSGYNADFYPDGRIRIPQSNGENREFLVPVFIENTWDPENTFDLLNNNPGPGQGDFLVRFTPEEFTSFEFSFYYDSSAVRFVDVVQTGQIHNLIEGREVDNWVEPIAADWDISVYTRPDDNYLSELFQNPSAVDAGKGWKATVTGVSSTPLPVTFGYEVFMYLKFEAVPDIQNPNTPATSLKTPLYISNDTIKYNDLNIVTEHPFDRYADINNANLSGLLTANDEYSSSYTVSNRTVPRFYDPHPTDGNNYKGTSGIDNYDPQNPNNPEPTQPGLIYVWFTDNLPKIQLNSDRGGSEGIIPMPEGTNRDEAERFLLTDPITVDASEQQPINAERLVRVTNSVNGSRYRYLEVETDQEWLLIEPVTIVGAKTDGIFEISDRKMFVNYVDAGILGSSVERDPLNQLLPDDGDLFINVIADPTKINNRLDKPEDDPTDPEKAGRYVGHITFSSPDAEISPIVLEVTFIYFRIPQEACERAQNVPRGIKLTMRNSDGQVGDRTDLIFGTGHRATSWESSAEGERGVDSLFGEFEYTNPGSGFWARFYPSLENGDIPQGYSRFGYGDWNPNSEQPRSSSRDIRSSDPAQKSHVYHVKFDANGANNYPVVVEWDIRDFRVCDDENGNQQSGDLFLKDTENGRLFPAINMREGTVIDANRRSYSFQDPIIDEFLIEYTLPNVIEFVDETGAPIIKRGWNLLSLPVNPTNKEKQNVYPGSISDLYSFEGRDYSQYDDEDNLEVGRGYFAKYGQDIDVTFAGTTIRAITKETFPVRVDEESWNLVGGISTPAPVEEITFAEHMGRQATEEYTLQYGVWTYVTARGYEEVSVILPGRGYWIKTDQDSYYELCANGCKKSGAQSMFPEKEAIRNSSTAITLADVAGQSGTVYFTDNTNVDASNFEMPPVPAPNVFDVRFNSNRQLATASDELIKVSGADYPVSITVKDADADYEFFSAVTGQELGRVRAGSNDEVRIDNENISLIGMRKITTGVENEFGGVATVYPNPASNFLKVNYTVGESSDVRIELVNALGGVVLADNFSATSNGTREIKVDQLVSGTYMVRIMNGDSSVIVPVTIAK